MSSIIIGGPYDGMDLDLPDDKLQVRIQHGTKREASYTLSRVRSPDGSTVEVWAPTLWCYKKVRAAYAARMETSQ